MEDILKFFGVMVALVSAGMFAYGGVTLIQAMQRRLERKHLPGLHPDELDAFRLQVEEGDQMRLRLAELEERVDFAERLLARHEETGSLPKPPE